MKLPCPVEKLLIRVEQPSGHSAAQVAAALEIFMRHHDPASDQVRPHSTILRAWQRRAYYRQALCDSRGDALFCSLEGLSNDGVHTTHPGK